MYAVIETGGKQYRVEVGTELAVELLAVEPGEAITLDRVLLVADGDATSVGRPIVDGATVTAEVVRLDRADKVVAFKYRPKARRRVKKGHRQEQTILRITDVVVDGRSAAESARKAEADAKTERERLEEAAARQAAEDAALAAKLAARTKPEEPAEAAPKGRRTRAAAAEGAGAETEGTAGAPAQRKSRAKAAPVEEPAAAAPAEEASEQAAESAEPAESADEASAESTEPAEGAAPAESAEAAPEASAPKRSRTKKDE